MLIFTLRGHRETYSWLPGMIHESTGKHSKESSSYSNGNGSSDSR